MSDDNGQQSSFLGGQRGYGCAWRALPIVIGLIAIAVFYFSHKQEGPFGRSQVVGLSPNEEMALGAQAYQQVLRQSNVVKNGPVADAVRHLADDLVRVSQQPEVLEFTKLKPVTFEWEVR